MRKLIVLFFLFANSVTAQDSLLYLNVDTVVKTDIYTSYYSFKAKQPLYVTYKLYKGGGDCKRTGMFFKNERNPKVTAPQDYYASGYDEGHLANAEDFAYDCEKMKETFSFYNCLPQTPNLNRGVWKHYEGVIRTLSQSDSLFIICGGIYYSDRRLAESNSMVPKYCFKIVQSLTTGQIIFSLLFTNDKKNNQVVKCNKDCLKIKLGFRLTY